MAEIRTALLFTYLIAFLFGAFRLYTRDLVKLTLVALLAYAGVVAVQFHFHPDAVNLRVELLRWVTLGATLFWFSLIGGHISKLRQNLRHSNNELKRALAIIEELAIRDELTGVYNRRHLSQLLRNEIQRSKRTGSIFCVCMIDIDHFKYVNDMYGHQAGDTVLQLFADALSRDTRTTDAFGRWGGEEFLVVLPATRLAAATYRAEKFLADAQAIKVPWLAETFKITASTGVAEWRPQDDLARILARVDAALYRAKAAGRNRVEVAFG